MALVLVIDDERSMRRLLCRILEDVGHQVLEAPDGRVGLQLFHQYGPNLIVTDIYMPKTEGIETIREIRAREPELPILAISGGGRHSIDPLWMASGLGATEVLAKPFRKEAFLDAVARLVSGQLKMAHDTSS